MSDPTPRFVGDLIDAARVSAARLEAQADAHLPQIRAHCVAEGSGLAQRAWSRAVMDALPLALRVTWLELWGLGDPLPLAPGWSCLLRPLIEVFDRHSQPIALRVPTRVSIETLQGLDVPDVAQLGLLVQVTLADAWANAPFDALKSFHEVRCDVVAPIV